jgi:hypothetical protein
LTKERQREVRWRVGEEYSNVIQRDKGREFRFLKVVFANLI